MYLPLIHRQRGVEEESEEEGEAWRVKRGVRKGVRQRADERELKEDVGGAELKIRNRFRPRFW